MCRRMNTFYFLIEERLFYWNNLLNVAYLDTYISNTFYAIFDISSFLSGINDC